GGGDRPALAQQARRARRRHVHHRPPCHRAWPSRRRPGPAPVEGGMADDRRPAPRPLSRPRLLSTRVMDGWAAALESLALARMLSGSAWLYPLVNAGHILGLALLLGAIVPLDLRLLGLWRDTALEPLWTVLGRSAACGLALAAACGGLLFITRATEYAASAPFVAKMACV